MYIICFSRFLPSWEASVLPPGVNTEWRITIRNKAAVALINHCWVMQHDNPLITICTQSICVPRHHKLKALAGKALKLYMSHIAIEQQSFNKGASSWNVFSKYALLTHNTDNKSHHPHLGNMITMLHDGNTTKFHTFRARNWFYRITFQHR